MADLSTLARPYAKAVFELARDAGSFAAWSEVLAGLAQAVKSPEVAALLGHPALAKSDLSGILGRGLSAEAQNLVHLLVDNHRLQAAPSIAEQYEALRLEAESRVDVEITSAVMVPEAQQQKLVAAIGKRLGRTVSVDWKTDESLVAGAMIRAGDLVIDGSVSGELDKLRTALTD